jgi:hemoglobin
MAKAISTSITRRSAIAGLTLTAASVAVLAQADHADAQEKSLYERLGGIFAIAAVIDHFSDAVVKNPIVGQESKNPHSFGNGTPRTWEGCPGSSSCGRFGSATLRVGFKFTATKPRGNAARP